MPRGEFRVLLPRGGRLFVQRDPHGIHVDPTRGSERAEARAAHVGSRFEPPSRDARDAPDAKNGSLPVGETRSDDELPVTFQ